MVRNFDHWRHRLIASTSVFVLLLVGGGYIWTFTPSYSVYHIKRALETHDYPRFSRYVDVASILDHALEEFENPKPKGTEELASRDSLAEILRGGLKSLNREIREVIKAGMEIAVEQAITDRTRSLPQIPIAAVVGALMLAQTNEDQASLPIKLKKGEQIKMRLQWTSTRLWRVVEIENLPTLLPVLQAHLAVGRTKHK
jgi:hypothetical protein